MPFWDTLLWKFGFSSQKHPRIQKYPSRSKFSIHRLTFAWKAITFITAGHRPTDKDVPAISLPERQNSCRVVQMNIHTGRKEHWSIRWFIDLLMNSGWCRRYNIQLRVFVPSWRINVLPSRQVSDDDSCHRINSAVMKIRNLKFLFLYFPFLYFLLITIAVLGLNQHQRYIFCKPISEHDTTFCKGRCLKSTEFHSQQQ